MQDSLLMPFQKTDAYRVAKELAVAVHRARIRDDELRDQAVRASKSAFLQLAEGLPNDSTPMRRKYFVCARNSACEVAAALDLALDLEAVDRDHAEQIASLAARLRALIIALLR
jgi:four helix bundle protein